MANNLLVVGSIAYDNIRTPEASRDWILGGSAAYAAEPPRIQSREASGVRMLS